MYDWVKYWYKLEEIYFTESVYLDFLWGFQSFLAIFFFRNISSAPLCLKLKMENMNILARWLHTG